MEPQKPAPPTTTPPRIRPLCSSSPVHRNPRCRRPSSLSFVNTDISPAGPSTQTNNNVSALPGNCDQPQQQTPPVSPTTFQVPGATNNCSKRSFFSLPKLANMYPYINSRWQSSTAPKRVDPFQSLFYQKRTYVYYNRYPTIHAVIFVLMAILGMVIVFALGIQCYTVSKQDPKHQKMVIIENACNPIDIFISLIPGILITVVSLGLLAMFRERVVVYWITNDHSTTESKGREYVPGKPGLGKVVKPRSLTTISPWAEDAIVDEMYNQAIEISKGGSAPRPPRATAAPAAAAPTPVLTRMFSQKKNLQVVDVEQCRVISSPEQAGPNRNTYTPWVPPPVPRLPLGDHSGPLAQRDYYQHHHQQQQQQQQEPQPQQQQQQQNQTVPLSWRLPHNQPQYASPYDNFELQQVVGGEREPQTTYDLEQRNKEWLAQRRREILGLDNRDSDTESVAQSAAWLPNWVKGSNQGKGKGKELQISGLVGIDSHQ
ncbi:hypothetical protein DFH27DRAFT_652411 [Peziza echinospora]|nr:hypothetical protein DFH27DRAFT_652411 [Peziza echinospora]